MQQGIILLKTKDKVNSARKSNTRAGAGIFSRGHFVFQPEPDILSEAFLRPESIPADL